ncbi:ATP-binding protein [Microbacterium nymphoidis]|uniref:ATP-binding protein n=1 Tax=Microbacterium nymphoidis TaxID=2898586 RepID=UPI001E4023F1|nr:ATP-binding protein [Microbacterium nymphoidis]MCD2499139.1 ATP-binding protein [Microbacterium nymphoidis]
MTDPPADTALARATTRLVDATMQRAVLGGVGVWHGFVILAALATVTADGAALSRAVAVHVALLVACLVCALLRLPALPCLIATFAGIAIDLATVPDWRLPLAFAAVWTAGITCATPTLILRPRRALLVGGGALIGHLALQIMLHPDWPVHSRLMVVVLGAILFVGARAMRSTIDEAAHHADEQAELARRSARNERIARDTGREMAEDARVLHDTIINTLSLICRGSRSDLDVAAARRRAAHDAAVIRRLTQEGTSPERAEGAPGRGGSWLAEEEGGLSHLVTAVAHQPGIPVEYAGPSEHDLERFESLLPVDASRAIVRAVFELITNAAKHSGARAVRLRLELQTAGVVVSVSDDGVGFRVQPVPGRGLAESVFRRCADVNVSVSLESAPGQGTTATLTYAIDAVARDLPAQPGADADLDARVIAAAGCWIWAGIILGADLLLSAFRPPAVAASSIAVSLSLAVLTVFARRFARRRRAAPLWMTVLLVASVPVGYLVPFVVITDAGEPLLFFPALVGTVPLVLLMMTYRSRVPLIVALVSLAASVAAACLGTVTGTASSLLIAIVAAAPQVGLFAGWGVFVPVLDRAVGAYRAQLRAASEAETGALAQNALTVARERWIRVGTRTSVALLEEIAVGEADPREPAVQQRCADEERYLRQLLLIDADVLHLSPWLAIALVKARSRAVPLEVRGGTVDSSDPATARMAGEVLLTVLDFCDASDRVIVSLFTEADSPVCLILGPEGLAPVLEGVISANGPAVECVSGASHTLISVRPPVAVAAADAALVSS